MDEHRATLLATGDLIIDEPDPDQYFELARSVLRSADVVVGHVEVPFTLQREATPNVRLEARDPAKLSALANAGVRVASLAANHLYDDGDAGVQDSIEGLRRQHIMPFGAGLNLDEARIGREPDLRDGADPNPTVQDRVTDAQGLIHGSTQFNGDTGESFAGPPWARYADKVPILLSPARLKVQIRAGEKRAHALDFA